MSSTTDRAASGAVGVLGQGGGQVRGGDIVGEVAAAPVHLPRDSPRIVAAIHAVALQGEFAQQQPRVYGQVGLIQELCFFAVRSALR